MAKYHQSYQNLRQFCEKWQWIDPRSGLPATPADLEDIMVHWEKEESL